MSVFLYIKQWRSVSGQATEPHLHVYAGWQEDKRCDPAEAAGNVVEDIVT